MKEEEAFRESLYISKLDTEKQEIRTAALQRLLIICDYCKNHKVSGEKNCPLEVEG